MPISAAERIKMARADSIGPRMIDHLEMIGIDRLDDLVGRTPADLAFAINMELGRKHINAAGVAALTNLVDLAEREGLGRRP